MIDIKTGKAVLTRAEYNHAAEDLECEPEALMAVANVETKINGFQVQRDGSIAPVILFESHVFGRLTGYKYNFSHPDISSAEWKLSSYGPSDYQHVRLAKAVKLNREAALKSCSWGKFQVLGLHYEKLGYKNLQDFINQQYNSELSQLDTFVRYIKFFGLLEDLQKKNWAKFARKYNGKNYKINLYDLKLKAEYDKLKKTNGL